MSGIIPDILAVDVASDAEAAFQIMEDIANSLKGLAFGLTGRHDYALTLDTINGDPPNTAPSFIVPDSDILRDDQWNGYEFVMTSGTTNGIVYVITDVTESDNRIHVAENLFADGVRDGDTFRLKGHRHNDQIGKDVAVTDISGLRTWVAGAIIPQTSGSCPTGWTDLSASFNGRFMKLSFTGSANSGSGSHGHTGGVSGTIPAGANDVQVGAGPHAHSAVANIEYQHQHVLTLPSSSPEPLFRTIKLCRKN